jgi:cephalosporin-C deacetylase
MDESELEAYWREVDEELAGVPARPVMEPMSRHSTPDFTVHSVHLTSIGPYRIFGYLSVPVGAGPFPALLQTPRYGSVNHVPDYNDRLRYVVLTLMHRGQRLADRPFSAPYPGLLTLGIDDGATYVYRGIVADCLRGAEFLLERPEVDPDRVAVVGDDLALLTAARRPRFAVLELAAPMLYRLMEARKRTSAYPVEEVNDYLRMHTEHEERVARTLALFDPLFHAPSVRALTLLSLGDEGALNGLPWLEPLTRGLGGPLETYQMTHEGGTDHDHLDAWLATRFGAQPMARFVRVPA